MTTTTTTKVRETADALRAAGFALENAKFEFRLAHEKFLVASGMDAEEARRLAFGYKLQD